LFNAVSLEEQVIEMPTERLETISKMVQVLSVVAGVVISVLSFNGAREAEARALQDDAERREVEAAKSFLDLRERLYLAAVQQAAVLSNPEVHSPQELEAAKKRFRELYVAELSMIEGIGVEGMMKAMAREVDPPLLTLTPAQTAAYSLAHELRRSLVQSWGIDEELVQNPNP